MDGVRATDKTEEDSFINWRRRCVTGPWKKTPVGITGLSSINSTTAEILSQMHINIYV